MAKIEPVQIDLTPAINRGVMLEQYLGIWAIEESAGLAMFDRFASMDLGAHITAHMHDPVAAVRSSRQSEGRIGVIDISGTMTKRGSSMSGAGSTIQLRREVRAMGKDPDVSAIVLRIDSPGGTVAGTADLAAEVAAAREQKPVVAFIEDLGASAAYWVASQATEIVANTDTARIGSIGTLLALYDMSGAAAMQGVRPVVIRSGQYKGAGFPGTEISEEQKAIWQTEVDQMQASFTAGVAQGRGMKKSEVVKLADGRVHLAQDAKQIGLIDRIESFDAVMARLSRSAGSTREKNRMSETTTNEPKAASWAELKAGCTGADTDFLASQIEANATLGQAQSAWMAEQGRRIEAERKAREEAEEKAAVAAKPRPGVQGVSTKLQSSTDEGGSAMEQFQQHVQALTAKGVAHTTAHQQVCRRYPDLRKAMVAEANAARS